MKRTKERLTKTRVEALAPGETAWDSDVAGFGARRQVDAPHYLLKYRFQRRQRWITIGRHGSPWTPDMARDRARELLGQLVRGVDPAAVRDYAGSLPSLAAFSKTYMEKWSEVEKKPASIANDRRYLDGYILPAGIAQQRIDSISIPDVALFHRNLRKTPVVANRCLALLSHMFEMAETWGLRTVNSNPCLAKHVARFPEKKHQRYLTTEEWERLGPVMVRLRSRYPYHVAGILLLMFTGARPHEIISLRRDAIDEGRGVALLREHKSDGTIGVKPLRLPAPAIEILRTLPRVAGNPYVLPGMKKGEHLADLNHVWVVIRTAAQLDDVRLYDLRHSFASQAGNQGFSLPQIGGLLGHTQVQTTQRYVHLAPDPLKQAAEDVAASIKTSFGAGHLSELTGQQQEKVVPIDRRRKGRQA